MFKSVAIRLGVVAVVAAIAYTFCVPPPVSHPQAPELPQPERQQTRVTMDHDNMAMVWMFTPTQCVYEDATDVFMFTCPKF